MGRLADPAATWAIGTALMTSDTALAATLGGGGLEGGGFPPPTYMMSILTNSSRCSFTVIYY